MYERTRSVMKITSGAVKGKELSRPKAAVYDKIMGKLVLKYVDKIISANEKYVEYRISTYNKD
jgi:hypothetical protein